MKKFLLFMAMLFIYLCGSAQTTAKNPVEYIVQELTYDMAGVIQKEIRAESNNFIEIAVPNHINLKIISQKIDFPVRKYSDVTVMDKWKNDANGDKYMALSVCGNLLVIKYTISNRVQFIWDTKPIEYVQVYPNS